MRHHPTVLYRSFVDDIIAGRKTIECRFGEMGCTPYKIVKPGDLIWLKQVSGPIRAVATALSVRYFHDLSPYLINLIRREWNVRIRAPVTFWESHRDADHVVLIWMGNVYPLKPFSIEKRDRRAWIVLKGPPRPGEVLNVK